MDKPPPERQREGRARHTANGIYYFIQFQPRELLLFVRLILSFFLYFSRWIFRNLWRATATVDLVLMNVDMFLVIECLYLSSCRTFAYTLAQHAFIQPSRDRNFCEDKRYRVCARLTKFLQHSKCTVRCVCMYSRWLHCASTAGTHSNSKTQKAMDKRASGKETIVKYFSSLVLLIARRTFSSLFFFLLLLFVQPRLRFIASEI